MLIDRGFTVISDEVADVTELYFLEVMAAICETHDFRQEQKNSHSLSKVVVPVDGDCVLHEVRESRPARTHCTFSHVREVNRVADCLGRI